MSEWHEFEKLKRECESAKTGGKCKWYDKFLDWIIKTATKWQNEAAQRHNDRRYYDDDFDF